MSIYLKSDTIKGDVTAKGFEGCIQLESAHLSLSRAAKVVVGRNENRHTGNLNMSEFTIRKTMDSSSNEIFQFACDAKCLDKIEVIISSNDGSTTPVAQYVLHDVIVSQFETDISSSNSLHEKIKLHFVKLEQHTFTRDSRNRVQGPKRAGYNLSEATTM